MKEIGKMIRFFAHVIKRLRQFIAEEATVIKERDPAIRTNSEIILYPSFRAMVYHRIAHWFYLRKHYFIARFISQTAAHRTGIEIHPGATIGKGLFIDHGFGVIIGETTIIGDNVTIFQGVTLGGTGKDKGKRHPTIGDNVMIGTGARVLGPLTVGENTKIGAGAVVLESVPANSTVVGVPGRVVRRDDIVIPRSSMDHIHMPDPVKQDIIRLQEEIDDLVRQQRKYHPDSRGTAVDEEKAASCAEGLDKAAAHAEELKEAAVQAAEKLEADAQTVGM